MRLMPHEMPRPAPPPVVRSIDADQAWRISLVRDCVRIAGQQRRLARYLGIHPAHVNRWLSGARPVPERYLQGMAELLEVAA